MKHAQSAMEFVLIVAFLAIAFVSVFTITNSQLEKSGQEQIWQTAEDIAQQYVLSHIDIALSGSEGLTSSFIIPATHGGEPFNVSLVDGRELIVLYKEFEYVTFLPVNLTGNLSQGLNIIRRNEHNVTLIPQELLASCLKVRVGGQNVAIELELPAQSPLRIQAEGKTYGIPLVDPDNSLATPLRIYSGGQVRALKRYTGIC